MRRHIGSGTEPVPSDGEASRGLVAVVDDEPAIVEVAAAVLAAAGFETVRADSASRCLALLERFELDAVLSDIRMDGMDGFALIEAIRQRVPALRTVVMTGHDTYEMVRSALAAGAYDYLDKPLDRHEELVATVERAVDATRLARNNARLLDRLAAKNAELAAANEELVTLNRRLRTLAHTDALTGLANRRRVDATLARTAADTDAPLSIALIDVDHFKRYNDRHGHAEGDRALRAVAQVLRAAGRAGDLIGRYGGEEFIALLPGTAEAAALDWAKALREAVARTRLGGGESVTVSVGVATRAAGQTGAGTDEMLRAADAALYAAKADGRDRVRTAVLPAGDDGSEALPDAA